MKLSHNQATILEMIIEAVDTDRALPVRIGPRAYGTAMPDYIHTELENWIVEAEDWRDQKQRVEGDEDSLPFLTKQRRSERHRQAERCSKCTAERISRMERAFDLIVKAVWDTDLRKCLLAFAMVRSLGWDWGRYLNNRNRKVPKKKAWLRAKSYRWIHKALQLIEAYVSKSEIKLPDLSYGRMRHKTAEIAHKSITSQNYSNRDDNPAAPMKIPDPVALASA